jgi:hypothetical protein
LEASDDIRRAPQSQPMQGGGGEARRVSLVTDDNHGLIEVMDLRDSMWTRRVETPFQHVAVDDNRACDLAITLSLGGWRVSISRAPSRIASAALRSVAAPDQPFFGGRKATGQMRPAARRGRPSTPLQAVSTALPHHSGVLWSAWNPVWSVWVPV